MSFQLTFDCRDPARLVAFWAEALGYRAEPPPPGHATWNAFWRSLGVPEDELDDAGDGVGSIVDPAGTGPRIAFLPVPEPKTVKNRLHLDLDVGGGRAVPLAERRRRIEERALELVAAGATAVQLYAPEGVDHVHLLLLDPEGNELCLR